MLLDVITYQHSAEFETISPSCLHRDFINYKFSAREIVQKKKYNQQV